MTSCTITDHSKSLWKAILEVLKHKAETSTDFDARQFLSTVFVFANSYTHTRSQMVLLLEFASEQFGILDCKVPFYNLINTCIAKV